MLMSAGLSGLITTFAVERVNLGSSAKPPCGMAAGLTQRVLSTEDLLLRPALPQISPPPVPLLSSPVQ